jgi:outer membrane protein
MSTLASSLGSVLVVVLASAAGAGLARAAEPPGSPAAEPVGVDRGLRAGDWLVRGRISGSVPTEQSSRITVIGGQSKTPTALLPDGDIAYFLTDHIAIEGQAGPIRTRPKIRNSRVGDIAIGSVWNAGAVATVQYHVLPGARLNPYFGVGVAVTTPIAIDPEQKIPNFTLESLVSPVLQAGLDYHLGGNWFGNVAVKYVFVPRQSYTIAGVRVSADLDMLIVGAGLGYRF